MVIILCGGLVKLFLIENNKMTSSQNLEKGAHNLLKNCANLSTDQKLIIISEDPSLDWYSHINNICRSRNEIIFHHN